MNLILFLESAFSNIDPSLVTKICNITLIVLVAIVLIGGIVGLIRGMWNATFRLVFVGLLVVLSYVLAGTIGDAVAEINLQPILNNMVITINGINVEVTSLKETLINAIGAIGTSQGGSLQKTLSDPSTLALITELALMVVRLITFILLAVIVVIVGNLLASILYHLIFKHIIPKKVRKKLKLRVVGFASGAVKSVLVLSMFVVPFSSILNTLSKANKDGDNQLETLDNETYEQLMNFIGAYDDSFLAKILFNWTKDADGNTLDMKLANIITSTDESTMTFTNELSSILGIASTLIGSGSVEISSNSITVNMPILLSGEIVSSLVSQITSSNLILQVLPIAANFALSIDGVEEYITENQIDFSSVDWDNDLNELNSFYQDLYNLDILNQEVINNPIKSLDVLLDVENENVHQTVNKAFKKLDNVTIINQLMSSFMWTIANQKNEDNEYKYPLHNYLSLDWKHYENIKWGNELSIMYDSIYRINKNAENAILEYATETNNENNVKNKNVRNSNNEETPANTLLDKIIDNASSLTEIIVGKRNENGESINVDSEGITLSSYDSCLLDSNLINNSFNKIVKAVAEILFSTIESNLNSDLSFENVETAINQLVNRLSYKKEFGAMLDIVVSATEKESLKVLFKQNGEFKLDEDTCNDLKEPISKLDNSSIITAIMPEVLKALCTKNEEVLKEYGIEVSSLNFEVDSLSHEFLNVLDAAPSIINIYEFLSDETSTTKNKIDNLQTNDLKQVLNCLCDSDILNHKWDDKKQNFDIVVDNLFTRIGYEEGNITDNISVLNWKQEIDNLGDFFDSLKNGGLTNLLVENGETVNYFDPNILNPDAIADIFSCIDRSKLLSTATGSIFDHYLKDTLENSDINFISFKNIASWESEGNNLASVIASMQSLTSNGEIKNIDILNSDICDVNGELLTKNVVLALEQSQLIKSKDDFSDYILETLKKIDGIKFNDITDDEEVTYNKVEEIFANITSNSNNDLDSGTWRDEISILFDFIKAMQNIGKDIDENKAGQYGSVGFDDFIVNPEKYTFIFTADGDDLKADEITKIDGFRGVNSSEILRMPIANIINDVIGKVNIDLLSDLKLNERINVNALVAMDRVSERNDEMKTVLDLLSNINELSSLNDFNEITQNEEKINSLKNALKDLHNSKVLNSVKNSLVDDTTVFEGFVISLLHASEINEDAFIGKIDTRQMRINNIEQLVKNIKNNRGDITKEDEWIASKNSNDETIDNGEIYDLVDVILSCQSINMSDLNNSDTWKNIDAYPILEALNNSKLLYRSIPYFMNELTKNETNLNINFKAAKIDYSFNNEIKDYESFKNEELENYAIIMNNLNNLEDLVSNDFNLSQFRGEQGQIKKDSLKEVLVALSKSNVFHLAGSNVENENTVFIQIVEEAFVKSSLYQNIYDESLFNATYLEKHITSAEENLDYKLLAYNDLTEMANSSYTWEHEIDNLINIFDAISENEELETIDTIELNTLKPEFVNNIFIKLNQSELCYDAVPIYVKELYTQIHLDAFTANYEVYLIDSETKTYREMYEDVEIATLHDLLLGIYDEESAKYLSFNNFSVTNIVKPKLDGGKGMSLTPIIRYITKSEVLKNCKGLVMMNAIKEGGFADNIRDEYSNGQNINVFTYILDAINELGEEQIIQEGTSLDHIVINLEAVISNNESAEDSFGNINEVAIKNVIKECYDTNTKSLLASEIVAGFLSNAIKDSAYLDDDYYEGTLIKSSWLDNWYKEDGIDFKYPLFNDLEANSVEAMIKAINLIKEVKFESGSLVGDISGVREVLSQLHNGDDNSYIALYLYEKAIYKQIMDNFATSIYNNKLLSLRSQEAQDKFDNHYENLYSDAQMPNFSFVNVETNINGMFEAIESIN